MGFCIKTMKFALKWVEQAEKRRGTVDGCGLTRHMYRAGVSGDS